MSGSVVAIVLAAGSATRFGADKLLAPMEGRPLLSHAMSAAWAAPADRVIIVSRKDAGLKSLCATFPGAESVTIASTALSDSLKAGLAAAGDAQAAFVFLGDMPRVPHNVAGRLLDALGDHLAAMPVHEGKPGHPVLLSREAMNLAAAEATGDRGAGEILRTYADRVARLEVADPGVILDVDTPADLLAAETHG